MSHRLPRLLVLMLALIGGLGTGGAAAQDVRPVTDRLDAIVSYPLVISIAAEDERDLRRGVTTRLDDGRTFVSPAYWVSFTPQSSLPAWTMAPGLWTASPYNEIAESPRERRPVGSWFIEIPLPIDAVGQGLWFGRERYELNWVPDPERSLLEADRAGAFDDFWSLHLDKQALADPAVRRAIEQYHRDPFQNWRARLATDGLDPDRSRARETQGGQSLESLEVELSRDEPGDELLRALARQQEARWQVILGQIWLIDPDVARRLKTRLMRTARFSERILPVWSSDTTEINRLAHDLLSPYVDDRTRTLRAAAWLETQPRALAWVTDEHGLIEAGSGRLLPRVTVLSLPPSPGASLLEIESGDPSPELVMLEPDTATPVVAAVEPVTISSMSAIVETRPIDLKLARWNRTLDVIASPIPARAPYLRIGPLLNDWTMSALVSSRPQQGAVVSANRSTAGILRKTTPPSRSRPTEGWQFYVEAVSPQPGGDRELLTLWTGPRGEPFAVWSITPDGRDGAQVEFIRGSRPSIGVPRVRTRILPDRWVAMIDLPPGVFDDEAQLQLGIERVDADGVHTAWPRRMIPGQAEPGRLLIRGDRFDQLRPETN